MALYNTHRPKFFKDIIGQDPVVAILKNQAIAGNFHHSYLCYGPSGTGKTTTARILASVLNCQNHNGTGEPCGECQSCRTIFKQENWDVKEIDGARFRGIGDIRNLLDTIYLYPFGKHKIVIFDEVQMLTSEAWSSLLKSIEEPPPYLVWIFCTTDIRSIPETVKSRCCLFPFTQLKSPDIKRKLDLIIAREGIMIDNKNLLWAIESSAGNMRSAENYLEQLQYCK